MTPFQIDLALFVIINLPSLVIPAFLARSWVGALGIGAVIKFSIILVLMLLGGGANASMEAKLISLATTVGAGALIGAVGYCLRLAIQDRRRILGFAGGLAGVGLWALATSGYIFSLWSDARNGHSAYFMADLLIPPFGLARGTLLLLGLI